MFERNVKYVTYALYAFVGVLFISAFLSFASNKGVQDAMQAQAPMGRDRLTIVTADGRKVSYTVELAVTAEEMERGLMHRESLDRNAGMLFIHKRVQEHAMWMKNTQIPLDMIFIDSDGTIARIRENARPYDLSAISSIVPVRAVLEVNSGQVAEHGIKTGDRVQSEALSNFQVDMEQAPEAQENPYTYPAEGVE